jgi:glutaminase
MSDAGLSAEYPITAEHFVSTGALPADERVAAIVGEAHERFRDNREGELSDVYPALARVAPEQFGICVVGTRGSVYAAGDAGAEFTIMSVAKPFVFALICDVLGPGALRRRIGVDATGLPFNSLHAVERDPHGHTNPMVNPGAIATTSMAPGDTVADKWAFIHDGLCRFAGRLLDPDDEIYSSASATNHRNQAIADLLHHFGRLLTDVPSAVDLYTRQSSLRVTARDLAVMGATLADGGVNPVTGLRVVDEVSCRCALAVMTTAGLYETSGTWLYDVGLPGKSGIGGGIVAVSPGKGALGSFAPLLDTAGNSVKGQLAARFLSRRLGLDLFMSEPTA